ncbi:hypothetical protein [Halobacterium sp. R2-5]|uniref:hypothetical protein n=1 Tax=Halobacterium sp. R2-5 TaxID=2715751 RepID=UPI0014201311|nr:hypothetical protein [Halobacterium sp. R2-5]NIC00950.1 hypothetical protein [Halobacterium sp. R2-5]
MRESESQDEESIAQGLIEDIIQLKRTALGEGAGSCHVCGEDVVEGMEVGVVVFRGAGSPAFEVQYVLCDDHLDGYSTEFTLGVREVVVRGQFGWYSVDESRLCPVVVSPTIVGVSEASTTSIREISDREGVSVDFGDRLVCERESGEGRVVPRMRVVMELPVGCRVEQPAVAADDEGVSGDGE